MRHTHFWGDFWNPEMKRIDGASDDDIQISGGSAAGQDGGGGHGANVVSERKPEQQPILLLIDDAPEIHRLLAMRLKDEGLEFLTAFSGIEGVELAEQQSPSLILLDVAMPDHDGFEVLHTLKENPATKQIPVIMLSGSHASEDKVRSFELGAMDYVIKPVDVPELRARIQSAIRLTRLMEMLEQRAQIDGLTGLWNRAHFDRRLTSELSEKTRRATSLALVMCDLDHFKRLNDSFGHPAGDAVLEAFAKIINQEIRQNDIACRYGGEEFTLILPRTGLSEAVGVCERIRKALSARTFRKYPEIQATASFGVTDVSGDVTDEASSWIEAADQALYSAKSGGRNCVHVFSADGCRPGTTTPSDGIRMAG